MTDFSKNIFRLEIDLYSIYLVIHNVKKLVFKTSKYLNFEKKFAFLVTWLTSFQNRKRNKYNKLTAKFTNLKKLTTK